MQSPNSQGLHASYQKEGELESFSSIFLPASQPSSKPLEVCPWDQKPASESPGQSTCRFLGPTQGDLCVLTSSLIHLPW